MCGWIGVVMVVDHDRGLPFSAAVFSCISFHVFILFEVVHPTLDNSCANVLPVEKPLLQAKFCNAADQHLSRHRHAERLTYHACPARLHIYVTRSSSFCSTSRLLINPLVEKSDASVPR